MDRTHLVELAAVESILGGAFSRAVVDGPRPVLVDLFCGGGGAAVGYWLAGFDVIGVDLDPAQLREYPFACVRGDALNPPINWSSVDAVHASPPCQGESTMPNLGARSSVPRLIGPTRELLRSTGLPWVIENVVGASRNMHCPITLTGPMFGLGVYRPRLFESNVLLMPPDRARRPRSSGQFVAVHGHRPDGRRVGRRGSNPARAARSLDEGRDAMGMPWTSWHATREAIPPAYTEFVGHQLIGACA